MNEIIKRPSYSHLIRRMRIYDEWLFDYKEFPRLNLDSFRSIIYSVERKENSKFRTHKVNEGIMVTRLKK